MTEGYIPNFNHGREKGGRLTYTYMITSLPHEKENNFVYLCEGLVYSISSFPVDAFRFCVQHDDMHHVLTCIKYRKLTNFHVLYWVSVNTDRHIP